MSEETETPESSTGKPLGKQMTTVGAVLIAASIIAPMMGVAGGTPSNIMLGVGLVVGVVGIVMSRKQSSSA